MLAESDMFPYQGRAAEHIALVPKCALWVPMGLGKTVSALSAIRKLKDNFECHKILVIAPKRVARKVWSDEINGWKHLSHLKYSKIIGSSAQRMAGIEAEADIYFIGRDSIKWLVDQYVQKQPSGKWKIVKPWPWDVVVVDECQSFKSQSTKRWKALKSVRLLTDRIVFLTGTPSPNGYKDLWGQFYILDSGQRLGASEKAFRQRWFEQAGPYKVELREGAAEEIQELISDIVFALNPEDHMDLPPYTNNYIRVTLDPRTATAYKQFKKDLLADFADKTVTAANAAVAMGKLLQVANGAIYHNEKREWTEIHREKLDALEEILDGTAGKALIAYTFKHDLARISALLNTYCKANGRTWKKLETEETENEWNRGEIDFLLLHPASAGHGLNLQKSGCETIVWFGLTNSLELYQQLNARLIGGHRRVGKNVVIHHIIADKTIDEDLVALLDKKGATQEDLRRMIVALARGGRVALNGDIVSVAGEIIYEDAE